MNVPPPRTQAGESPSAARGAGDPAPGSRLIVQHPVSVAEEVVSTFSTRVGVAPVTRTPQSAIWRDVTLARDDLRGLAGEYGVDAAWLPQGRRLADYRLIAFDMDSTLITIECIDEIADFAGLKAQVAAITEATMRGEIADFNESLRRRVALLRGLPESVLQQVYDQRLRLSPGVESLLAAARGAGLKILLVSGGFEFFTERLKSRLDLDFTRANRLEIADGRLTGQVLGDIVNADAKQQTVAATCAAIGATPDQAIVVGDGANDLKMMAVAGVSVAYRAKPVVQAQTTCAINVCGLDSIVNFFD